MGNYTDIQHKGWDWSEIDNDYWTEISEEFYPIARQWCNKFHSILDVGAGKGRHALYFAENGLEVSAVDLSETSIAYIERAACDKELFVNAMISDMTHLPFEDAFFDGVICFHTIYHTDYEGVKRALREIYRVLRSGGEAYLTFNSKDNPNYRKELSKDGFTMLPEDGFEKGIPHCYLDENDLFEILKDFQIISMDKIQHYIRKGRDTHGIHFFVHLRKA